MGYLDNTTLTVDAVLTTKGRQILALGGQLSITKFALSDDEVDYNLWNPTHTLGSNYYGAVIENMPVLEAVPNDSHVMKSKLITLPRNITAIPILTVQGGPVTFTSMTGQGTITATVSNLLNANASLGYTAILSDNTVATLQAAPDSVLNGVTVPTYISDQMGISGNSVTAVSRGKFLIKPKSVNGTKTALLTIFGNETGGFETTLITCVDTANSLVIGNLGNGSMVDNSPSAT